MRILFATSRPPWPPRRGDQARTAGWVAELAPRHEISIVSQVPAGFSVASPPSGIRLRAVQIPRLAMGKELVRRCWSQPLQVAMHHHQVFCEAVNEEVRGFRPDVLVVVLARLGSLAADTGIPRVLDLIDSLALNMRRRAARQGSAAAFWKWEARRIGAFERSLVGRYDLATVVSERDREAIRAAGGVADERLQVVPFGVPLAGLDVPGEHARPSPETLVLLSGNLGYFPTVDGACWFVEQVWPRVYARRPDARFLLAGARPGVAIRRLARRPGVQLIAEPEDLAPLRRRAAVAVAPLRSGSGTPIKILEAIAAGLPVVTTSHGEAGLDALVGGELAVADDPEAFAAAVVALLVPGEAAERQRRRAWQWLVSRHDRQRVARHFERRLLEVVERHRAGGAAAAPRSAC